MEVLVHKVNYYLTIYYLEKNLTIPRIFPSWTVFQTPVFCELFYSYFRVQFPWQF